MTPAVDEVFFNDVTDSSIEQANTLLEYLVKNLRSDWEALLAEVCSPSEYELNVRNVRSSVEVVGAGPLGAIKGGTGSVKEAAGLSGEDSQRAIRLLKKSGRLIQAGKGRGKALVILSSAPLSMDSFTARSVLVSQPATQGEAPLIPADDISGLLRAARDGYKALQAAYIESCAQLDRAAGRISSLEERCHNLEAELERAKATQAVVTWS